MLARTKGIGAGGFRARPADGAQAATGGVSRSPRWDGLLGRIVGRRAPRPSIKVRQQLPGRARYVVVVGRQEPAVRAPRARARHCPKAIRAHGACRRPGTTPSQLIPAAGDADRDHLGDAVEGAARPGADSRCRAAAVRCRSNVPASSIASVCSASSAVMSASLMRAAAGCGSPVPGRCRQGTQ